VLNIGLTRTSENSDTTLDLISVMVKAFDEGEGGEPTIPCYWTFKTGLFANWNIMKCYSCIPEEVKEFRDPGLCSLGGGTPVF
jgi:hypothetical protein